MSVCLRPHSSKTSASISMWFCKKTDKLEMVLIYKEIHRSELLNYCKICISCLRQLRDKNEDHQRKFRTFCDFT